MARIPKVINNGQLADNKIDGTWFQDGHECFKVQGAYGQQVYIRDDYKEDILSRKATNDNVVGELDRYGVEMKIHYHLPINAFNGRVYALCETVNGGIVRCASNKPNTVILRFPTYRNLSALSKILHSFDEVDAVGDTVYVTFKVQGADRSQFEVPYEGADKLVKALQEERKKYIREIQKKGN